MGKAKKMFCKKLAFREYILAIKYFMRNKKITHISGFCDTPFVCNPEISEEELSDLFRSACKHKVFIAKGDSICIHPQVFAFMNAWAHSVNIVTLHKPSYQGEKLITIGRARGGFLATVQDVKRDTILLLADESLDRLYEKLEEDITEKDVNRAFKLKKINQTLEQNGIHQNFSVRPVFQLVVLCVENKTGKKQDGELTFCVGKKEYEIVRGAVTTNLIEKKDIGQFRNELLSFIEENCPEPPEEEKKESKGGKEFEDPEEYTTFSYQKLIHTEGYPLNRRELLKFIFYNIKKGIVNWKHFARVSGIYVAIAVLALVWNMFGMCYLNNTFRIDQHSFLGNATAYLFAGTIGFGSGLKGFSFVRKSINTVYFATSFYVLLAVMVRSLWQDIAHRKVGESIREITEFPSKIKQYINAVDNKISYYLWAGFAIASSIGMVLWNPFSVFLLSLMLLCSCMKCERGMLAPLIMLYRTSADYQKVQTGKKKYPMFADIQLWLFGLGLGFLFYSGANLLVWFLFDYNLWVRIIFTVLFIVIALLKLGIVKISRPNKTASAIMLFLIAGILILLSQNGIILADDGGWTESGGSLLGLFRNSGFATILTFSLVLGIATVATLATFGAASTVVLAASAAVTGVSALWAATTEQGRKTAYDFVMGGYSPYGGDDEFAAGLSFFVGLAPGVGEVFSLCTGTRDTKCAFENGNIISALFSGFCTVAGISGIGDDVAKATGKAIIGEGMEDVAGGAMSHADDIMGKIADSACDSVKQNIGVGAAGVFDEQIKQMSTAGGNTSNHSVRSTNTGSRQTVNKVMPDKVDGDLYMEEKPRMYITSFDEIMKESSEEEVQKVIEILNSGAMETDEGVNQIMEMINEYMEENPSERLTKESILEILEQYWERLSEINS